MQVRYITGYQRLVSAYSCYIFYSKKYSQLQVNICSQLFFQSKQVVAQHQMSYKSLILAHWQFFLCLHSKKIKTGVDHSIKYPTYHEAVWRGNTELIYKRLLSRMWVYGWMHIAQFQPEILVQQRTFPKLRTVASIKNLLNIKVRYYSRIDLVSKCHH